MGKTKTPTSDNQSETQGLDENNGDIIQFSPDKPEHNFEPDILIDDDPLIVIQEDIYPFGYLHYETCQYKDSAKIKMYFKLLDGSEHHGSIFVCFFPIEKLLDPPRKYGGFKPKGRMSKLLRTMEQLFGKLKRGDRFPWNKLKHGIITARVKTVKTSWKKDTPLSIHSQYSEIENLLSFEKEDE
jgi:hypothetical protein